jgi:uncharacterized delta-60 repeat protein
VTWGKGVIGFAAVFFAVILGLPAASLALPGDRDTGFGINGLLRAQVDPGAEPVLRDLIRLPDGSLIASGGSGVEDAGILVRFSANGELDPEFGTGGIAKTPTSLWASLFPVEGGKIVAFGRVGSDPAVARFNEDGSLDSGFGTGGISPIGIRGLFRDTESVLATDGPGVDSEGRIVASVQMPCSLSGEGNEESPPGYWFGEAVCGDTALVRLAPDGSLDSTFGGGDGVTIVAAGAWKMRSSFGDNDVILLASSLHDAYNDGDDESWSVGQRFIRRLLPDGTVDAGFGESGWVTFSDERDHPRAGILTGDGEGGVLVSFGQTVIRLLASGQRDPAFGSNGEAPTAGRDLSGRHGLSLNLTDGVVTEDHIYLSGAGTPGIRNSSRYMVVVRLNMDGNPDPTFSNDGLAFRRSGPRLPYRMVQRRIGLEGASLVVDADGRATAGITSGSAENLTFALGRFRGGEGRRLSCGGRLATVQGTSGDDRLQAGTVTVTGDGSDSIGGSGGLICAGSGDDRVTSASATEIRLGPGDDISRNPGTWALGLVKGGAGDDRLIGAMSRASGGPGEDLIDGSRRKRPVANSDGAVYSGGPGRDRLFSGRGTDLLLGGSGPDILRSGAEKDRLFGGRGNDRLYGGASVDQLFGVWGNDRLFGGAASDRLYGGPGRDFLDGGGTGPNYRRYYVRTSKARGLIEILPGKIATSNVRFLQRCSRGARPSWVGSGSLAPDLQVKKGRFKAGFFVDYSLPNHGEMWSREKLSGVVRRNRIVLRISLSDQDDRVVCHTGRLRIVLKRIPALRQIERQ